MSAINRVAVAAASFGNSWDRKTSYRGTYKRGTLKSVRD